MMVAEESDALQPGPHHGGKTQTSYAGVGQEVGLEMGNRV